MVDVNQLFEELGAFSQVEAIALGGSRATGRNDEKSDYDVYVYVTGSIEEEERREVEICHLSDKEVKVMIINKLKELGIEQMNRVRS